MAKRILDLVVAITMLIPVLPVLGVVAVILKFTGERQALYPQDRMGKGGKPFKLLKFVTMVANSEQMGSGDITLRDDPRVLPFGKFLRKTKINELPQLFNVIRGDMSVVGWRPLLEAGFMRYPPHVREALIQVKPGLTGLGSIMFRDEEQILSKTAKDHHECYRDDILPYKGELEIWYIQHQSLWLDIKIIVATGLAVLLPNSELPLKMFPGLPQPPPGGEIERIRTSTSAANA